MSNTTGAPRNDGDSSTCLSLRAWCVSTAAKQPLP